MCIVRSLKPLFTITHLYNLNPQASSIVSLVLEHHAIRSGFVVLVSTLELIIPTYLILSGNITCRLLRRLRLQPTQLACIFSKRCALMTMPRDAALRTIRQRSVNSVR